MRSRVTYKSSGVDIRKANAFIASLKDALASTCSPDVLKRTSAFGSLFSLEGRRYRAPVLVSSTDGVGTKLLLAKTLNRHKTVGIDLVGMNVNDILCMGATPLFFLDYIACGKIRPGILKDVVEGICEGCRRAGMSLIGGETAEMPGMYRPDDYDLAGFAVGIVEKKAIIDGSRITPGDRLLGLPSSGLHSNGYTLVRKVLTVREVRTYARVLMAPTRIYVSEVLPLLKEFSIKGLAHITGGAYYDKLTKILPPGMCFRLEKSRWPVPEIFRVIQKKGRIDEQEMYRTFNMGIGLGIVVSAAELPRLSRFLEKKGIRHYAMGEVIKHPKKRILI